MSSYDIIQNEVIGAHALWEFCKYYHNYHPKSEFPKLIFVLPVLPIVFNERARSEISNRNFKEGSLIRTINEHRDIYSGLQDRMEGMVDLTLKSLNNCVAFNLVEIDNDSSIIPKYRPFPKKDLGITKDYDLIIQSSRRIGAWFGQLDINEIMVYFNITL